MPEESAAQRICRRVLSTAHSLDANASVTSVARLQDDNDSTLVRIKAGANVNPGILVETLRAAWPLAYVGVVENYASGTQEAQVVVPSSSTQHEIARSVVSSRAWAARLSTVSVALLWASAATFGGLIVAHLVL